MARRYFGTDGVRGIVGEFLTVELVERLGRAATFWMDGGTAFIGRDTRGSGPELEAAFARGVIAAGGSAVLGGVLPLACDCAAGASTLASSSLRRTTRRSTTGSSSSTRTAGSSLTSSRSRSRRCSTRAPTGGRGQITSASGASERYLDYVVEQFGSDLSGLRIAVDCANGAYSGLAPRAFERLGAEVHAIGDHPDGSNINTGCGATDLGELATQCYERRARPRCRVRRGRRPDACGRRDAARPSTAIRSSPCSRFISVST